MISERVWAQIRGSWRTAAQIRAATGLDSRAISRALNAGRIYGLVESQLAPNPEPSGRRMVYRYRLKREPRSAAA